MTAPVLSIDGLSHSYRSNWLRTKIVALENLSLEIRSGECFGFLGHNGAGKTTTIKCILGLVKPTAGTVEIFGDKKCGHHVRQLLGYLPEQPYFYDHLTVEETLQMYATLAAVSRSAVSSSVNEVIEKLKLSKLRTRRLRELSKGQTQRLGFAQAIINRPKIIILDEPFSGLDPLGRREFRELIMEENARGTTIFMSTHVLSDVEQMCERASILAQGKLRGVFDIQSLKLESASKFTLIAPRQELLAANLFDQARLTKETEQLASITFDTREDGETALRACLDADVSIVEYHREQASLEDLFVRIVSQTGT